MRLLQFLGFGKKTRQRTQSEEMLGGTIRREVEILRDCIELVNDSATFSVVVHRYQKMIELLEKLSNYTSIDLSIAGITPDRPFQTHLEEIKRNRDVIYNQAIQRAFDKTLRDAQSLKTEKGKQARITRFIASIRECDQLSQKNIDFLNALLRKHAAQ